MNVSMITKDTLVPIGLSVGVGIGLYYVGLAKGQIESKVERNAARIESVAKSNALAVSAVSKAHNDDIAAIKELMKAERDDRLETRRRLWATLRKVDERSARMETLLKASLDEKNR